MYSRTLPWGVWKLSLPLLFPLLLSGGILPQFIGTYKQVAVTPLTPDNRAVWNEYGLQAAERSTYEVNGKKLSVDAYRLQDSTGALAAWQWKRPANSHAADAKMEDLSKLTAIAGATEAIALGNHLVIFDGYLPTPEEAANVFRSLPNQQSGPLPTLPSHVPDTGLSRWLRALYYGPCGARCVPP